VTENVKGCIRVVLLSGMSPDSKLDRIVSIIDKELAEVLTKTMQFGELLEAVGLEIRAKE